VKNKLIQLLRDNSAAPSAIRCQKAGDVAEVYLKGVISADFGVSASDLREAFTQAEGAPVNLFVNSPGGDVFEGREMQGVIAGYKGKVTAVVQGIAASAATIVTMAADETHMLKGSRFMIHNGWTITFGDRHAHQDTFKLLAGFDAELAAEYAKYTGKAAPDLVAMMDAETWFTAEEALQAGFVQQLLENSKAAVSAELRAWNLKAYTNAPDLSALGDLEPPGDYVAIRAQNERRLRLLTLD
jgi:ATP-dependent Clp protease protease subunit